MSVLHVWPEEPGQQGGSMVVAAAIEAPGCERKHLWYKIPLSHAQNLPANCDPLVLGTVFLCMQTGVDVRFHGPVSPSLLRNLAEFQAAWVAMKSDLTNVDISAEQEQEPVYPPNRERALVAFSGGVDSCFTAFRHVRGVGLRFPRPLAAAVMVHGFDIPLDEPEAFASAADRSRRMLSSLGLELITVATNFREVITDWTHSHGAAIASCLALFSGGFSEGLIGQTFTYRELKQIVEGVNALTDPLLSSDSFRIVPDGASFERADKIFAMRNWDEFLSGLRVCWAGQQKDRNCCVCEKCIRNILIFRALGLGLPPGFDQDVAESKIKTMNLGDPVRAIIRYGELAKLAETHGATGTWVRVLEKRLAAYRWSQRSKVHRYLLRKQRKVLKYLEALWRYAGRAWTSLQAGKT